MVRLVMAMLLVACGKGGPTAEPTREPPGADPRPAPAIEAAVESPPRADAAPIEAPAGALVETEGTGACKVDADCTLSTYQAGCCVQGCQPYARNRRDLEEAIAAEAPACETFRRSGEPCPPPAPCPRPTHEPVAAKCVEQRCYTVKRELVAGGTAPDSKPPGSSP